MVNDPNDLIQRQSRILILDYDVTRFHSFDLFRYLLLNKSFFMQVDPIYLDGMIRGHKPIAEQVDFYRSTCSSLNPFDNFTKYKGSVKPAQLDSYMNAMFQNKNSVMTETELGNSLYTLLCANGIQAFWVHYRNDLHKAGFMDATHISDDVVDEMFKPDEISDYIIRHAINSMIIGSVELAVIVSYRLIYKKYTTPMTIMICSYNYNYTSFELKGQSFKVLKHGEDILGLQNKYQYEFGTIDPYTGISRNKRLLEGR